MREALRSRSTLLVVAALLVGGSGGFALGHSNGGSSTTATPQVGARTVVIGGTVRTVIPPTKVITVVTRPSLSAPATTNIRVPQDGRHVQPPPPPQFRVPTVISKDLIEAETILRDAGLKVAVKSAPNPAKPSTVLEQNPTAGSRSVKGSTVTLTVSTGAP